jgi:biopolymer transport protein ExbD
MNITPLIDVVFLLIIFFMLVNNIVTAESVQMRLPELEDPQTRELGEVDRIVVNIVPAEYDRDERAANPLSHQGTPAGYQVGIVRYGLDGLPQITEQLRAAKAENPEVQVLLRADSAIYYQAVQPVIAAITAAEIGRINLVAYQEDQ